MLRSVRDLSSDSKGVILPLPSATLPLQRGLVALKRTTSLTEVKVVAELPLLRLGLERLVADAGLRQVSEDQAAKIVLRSTEEQAAHTGIDIAAGKTSVTLTLHDPPDAGTWAAILQLLRALLTAQNLEASPAPTLDPGRSDHPATIANRGGDLPIDPT